jgi:hypothetical protein
MAVLLCRQNPLGAAVHDPAGVMLAKEDSSRLPARSPARPVNTGKIGGSHAAEPPYRQGRRTSVQELPDFGTSPPVGMLDSPKEVS